MLSGLQSNRLLWPITKFTKITKFKKRKKKTIALLLSLLKVEGRKKGKIGKMKGKPSCKTMFRVTSALSGCRLTAAWKGATTGSAPAGIDYGVMPR